MRSRSSHSLSSYNTAASRLLRPSRLSYQSPSRSWMLPCRRLHLVTPFRMCPRRRLFNRTCFRVMWPFRRLSIVLIPYPWMLLAQTTSPSTLSQHVSTKMRSRSASSFSVDTSVQTPIRCVVQHDAATQLPLTEFFIGCIYSNSPLDRKNHVRQSPPSLQGSHVLPPRHRLDSNSQSLPLSLLLIRTCSPMLAVLPAIPSSRLSVPLKWEHTLYAQLPAPKRSASTALAGTP